MERKDAVDIKELRSDIKNSKVLLKALVCPECRTKNDVQDLQKDIEHNLITCPDCNNVHTVTEWLTSTLIDANEKSAQQDAPKLTSLKDDLANYLKHMSCPVCGSIGLGIIINSEGDAELVCGNGDHILQDTDESKMCFCGVPVVEIFLPAKQREKATEITDTLTKSQKQIIATCREVEQMLLEKNRKYGDSALHPTRCFSKANVVEQIKVRLDDKLSRLKNEQSDEDEDVIKDIIGYLILLRIASKK